MAQRNPLAWLPSIRDAQQARRSARPQPPEQSMDPRADHRRPADDTPPVQDSVIDAAVYVDGRRQEGPTDILDIADLHRRTPSHAGALAWIGLLRPSSSQLLAVADEFGLHALAVEDAIVAHQRPKLERYDDTLFVVLKSARYLDAAEEVEFGEIHLFVGKHFVITVRHNDAPDLSVVRKRLEDEPELLARGPEAVLYAVLDAVVDGYAPVVAGLQNDIDEIETQVFAGDPAVSRRIYKLSREVIEFQRAAQPLLPMLRSLGEGFEKYDTDEELRRYLRDVADHATTVAERVSGFRDMLQNILTVNATLVTEAQNDEMRRVTEASYLQGEQVKKISAWAAILFAPSLITGVYGMNFTHMPELDWVLGYPWALVLMVGISVALYVVFKWRKWM
ncbi:magnesium and cobalt transport protein CorA [Streptomonospora nanhaiensis]|uniref:magnesium and cobalt transport protein CorA n=1 Tax=Streptomonospora nanhaiensis TaxID=1323731 RepID=UPI001C38B1E5|nr:magnesium and cobalt transport protein CorA [Streptomonospora nanhaiensis]MBV2364400.1 magnesium and cobalt transport protein CorA [Streptomonospora nanhaiensis]MBX9388456.1 magnesium and cobalt transport protein CorA [Streptomonospora nanhaiensis]